MVKTKLSLLFLLYAFFCTNNKLIASVKTDKSNRIDFTGNLLLDYINILFDQNWDSSRIYKNDFLTNGHNLRYADFGLTLGHKLFSLRWDLEVQSTGSLRIGNLFLQKESSSGSTDLFLGQFSHNYCDFNSESHQEKPIIEQAYAYDVFYRNSCKGLGFRLRYKRYYWGMSTAIKGPELGSLEIGTSDRFSYHLRTIFAPLQYDRLYVHLEGSYLLQDVKSRAEFYTNPGIYPRESTQIIRTDILASDYYYIINFEAQSIFFKNFQFEWGYSWLNVISRELVDIYNKDLTFRTTHYSLFYNWGVSSFSYDPFDGFYNFKPYYPKVGIIQAGLLFRAINLSDGKRANIRQQTGVEGGQQLSYLFALAWKYSRFLKVSFNYLLTNTANATSVVMKKTNYVPRDWLPEEPRSISGYVFRIKIGF